jgi:hypothetical protein
MFLMFRRVCDVCTFYLEHALHGCRVSGTRQDGITAPMDGVLIVPNGLRRPHEARAVPSPIQYEQQASSGTAHSPRT